jgi:hypothetical protein
MQWNDPDNQRFDRPLDIEDLPEFHAARLLVLMRICGEGQTGLIRGRMKLAKLDFFVRYPRFLEAAVLRLRRRNPSLPIYRAGSEGVEATMVRYRYGPWDHRYYNLLGLLDARGLIRIGGGAVETYSLTDNGRALVHQLLHDDPFAPVANRCRVVAKAFEGLSGTKLKDFVYETFIDEVASLPRGALILPLDPTTEPH